MLTPPCTGAVCCHGPCPYTREGGLAWAPALAFWRQKLPCLFSGPSTSPLSQPQGVALKQGLSGQADKAWPLERFPLPGPLLATPSLPSPFIQLPPARSSLPPFWRFAEGVYSNFPRRVGADSLFPVPSPRLSPAHSHLLTPTYGASPGPSAAPGSAHPVRTGLRGRTPS